MISLATFMGGAREVLVSGAVKMHKMVRFWHVRAFDGIGNRLELPDARTLKTGGPHFLIENYGETPIGIRPSGEGSDLFTLLAGQRVKLHLLDNSTESGNWIRDVRSNGPSGTIAKKHAAVIGGQSNPRDVSRFDPTTDTWSAGTSGSNNRDGGAAFQASDHIFIGGDFPIGAGSVKFDRYYMDSWRAETDLPTGTARAGAGYAHGLGYVISGQGIAAVQQYNPVTRSWRAMKDIGYARESPTCSSIKDKIYLICGKPFGVPNLVYSPLSDSFHAIPDYVGPQRQRLSGFNLLQTMYVCGGRESDVTVRDEVEKLDTVTETWSVGPVLPMGARFGGAGFAVNGLGYFATGKNQGNALQLQAAEIFNDTWTSITAMTQGAFRVENSALPTP